MVHYVLEPDEGKMTSKELLHNSSHLKGSCSGPDYPCGVEQTSQVFSAYFELCLRVSAAFSFSGFL